MGVLIPLFGVSIPLVVVFGKFILQPMLAARLQAAGGGASARVEALERRVMVLEHNLDATERTVERLREEADFLRQLAAPAPAPAAAEPVRAA